MKYFLHNLAIVCSILVGTSNSYGEASATNSAVSQFDGEVDIGGRKLHLATYGQGSPTVVVESGLGEPGVEGGSWKAVIDEVSKTARICVYDRAGLGTSDAVTNKSRTTQDVVQDLHALLTSAKIAPPYILVGHSVGGYTVRVYADKYPSEVAGLVLVDSSYPGQGAKWLAALPPESAQESESIKNARTHLTPQTSDPNTNPEHLDLAACGVQAAAVTSLGNKPLVVLSHAKEWRMDTGLPKETSDKMEQLWETWQEDLCHLSTQSSHQTAVKAGHYIQPEEPQLVVNAIHKIADLTRSGKHGG